MSSGIVSGLLPNYPTTVPMSVSEQHRTVCTDVAKQKPLTGMSVDRDAKDSASMSVDLTAELNNLRQKVCVSGWCKATCMVRQVP